MSINQFRNILIYRIVDPAFQPTPRQLEEALETKKSRPIAASELSTYGFVEPLGQYEGLVEIVEPGVMLIAALKQEKMLPSRVVKEALDAKIAEIEEEQMRKVYKKERDQLKDDIVQSFLPRAFVTRSRIQALIMPPYILVDNASPKKAEDLLTTLREALGSLPVRPFAVRVRPTVTMTDWVLNGIDDMTERFSVGETFQSRAQLDESQTLSGKGVTLSDEDLHQLLRAGQHEVTQLELVHNSDTAGTSFTLTEGLALKGIDWPEEVSDQVGRDCGDDEHFATVQRATLLILSRLLREMITDLGDALGGEDLPAPGDAEPDEDFEDEDEEELV